MIFSFNFFEIKKVISLDKDSIGSNSDISYKILFETHQSLFKIYKSGVISNKVIFDRENQSVYTLKIEAYDNGEPIMSTIGIFHIKIEDENDNKPTFVYPHENVRYLHHKLPKFKSQLLSTRKNGNETLIKLFDAKAIDLDEGNNAKISFYIEDSFDLLHVNQDNGTVYLNYANANVTNLKELNDFKKIIDVILKINDSGSPALSSTLKFVFYLNYVKRLPFILNIKLAKKNNSKTFVLKFFKRILMNCLEMF